MPNVRRVVDEVDIVKDERRRVVGQSAELAEERIQHGVERRRCRRRLAEECGRRRGEVGHMDPHRRHEIRDEPDPVAVPAVEPKPEHTEARSAREVREEGRLPVAGLGDQQDGAPVDLDRKPLEQPVARQRLLAERWRLHLADLDRVLGHGPEVPSRGSERGQTGSNALDHESRPALRTARDGDPI